MTSAGLPRTCTIAWHSSAEDGRADDQEICLITSVAETLSVPPAIGVMVRAVLNVSVAALCRRRITAHSFKPADPMRADVVLLRHSLAGTSYSLETTHVDK